MCVFSWDLVPDKCISNKNCVSLWHNCRQSCSLALRQINYILFKIPLGKRKQCNNSDEDEEEERKEKGVKNGKDKRKKKRRGVGKGDRKARGE